MAVKSHRGGKHYSSKGNKVHPRTDTAGQRHELQEKEWVTKREFVGSGQREYVFYSETQGTLTIRANNYWDALRQAKARGYSRRKYRRKK